MVPRKLPRSSPKAFGVSSDTKNVKPRWTGILPSKKIAIAVTFAPEAFDSEGNYKNSSDTLFRSIGAYLAPDDAPPPAKN